MSRNDFIKFVKMNPSLVDYVKNNNASWQSLYEVYSLYGEDSSVWNKYLNTNRDNSINELISIIKNINLESVRKVIDGLQKTIGLIQEIGGVKENVNQYQKSPVYEDLDD